MISCPNSRWALRFPLNSHEDALRRVIAEELNQVRHAGESVVLGTVPQKPGEQCHATGPGKNHHLNHLYSLAFSSV